MDGAGTRKQASQQALRGRGPMTSQVRRRVALANALASARAGGTGETGTPRGDRGGRERG